MKILKEIERQSSAPREAPAAPQQQSKKQRRAAKEAAQQQSMQQAAQDTAQADEWEAPQASAPSNQQWSRQRVVDALQMMMMLGPPPGLED